MLTTARVLLTIVAVQYGVVPIFVDLSPSHVFHDEWPPHARFHMVWLIASSAGIAAFTVWAAWGKYGNDARCLRLVCIPGLIVLGSFFVATLLKGNYAGELADPAHQILILGVDGNLFAFSIALVLQITATFMVLSKSDQ